MDADDLLLISPRETGRLLNYGRDKVYELIANGELKSFKEGTARKITVSSVHAYIKRRLREAKQETPEEQQRKRRLREGQERKRRLSESNSQTR
jgi:excisionase family DNA binding protein